MSTHRSPWWTRAAVAGVAVLLSGCTDLADPLTVTALQYKSSNGMTYDFGSSVTATGNPGEARLETFSQGISGVAEHSTGAKYDIDMLCDGTYESTGQDMGTTSGYGTEKSTLSVTIQGSTPWAARVNGTHIFSDYSGEQIAIEYSVGTGCITS